MSQLAIFNLSTMGPPIAELRESHIFEHNAVTSCDQRMIVLQYITGRSFQFSLEVSCMSDWVLLAQGYFIGICCYVLRANRHWLSSPVICLLLKVKGILSGQFF